VRAGLQGGLGLLAATVALRDLQFLAPGGVGLTQLADTAPEGGLPLFYGFFLCNSLVFRGSRKFGQFYQFYYVIVT